ncbi:MAG TPA: hypothetical protein VN628_14715 [Vicinamibacterales bacterium]|nr:hypothetical protein [Vicinamibacterales bacterium]
MSRLRAVAALAVTALAAAGTSAKEKEAPVDLAGLLARVAERVEAFYERAQSIVCNENISYDTLDTASIHSRRVVFELRMSWEKSDEGDVPEGKALRTLKTVNGRAPRDDKDETRCLDPKPVAVDTLSFLLPQNQHELTFTYKGIGKVGDGRTAAIVEYVPNSKDKPKYSWHDSCFGIEAPARTRGRVYIDRFSGDVLRVDESIAGPLDVEVPREEQRRSGNYRDYITLDHWDFSIRYKSITFSNPDEIVLLPDNIEYFSTIRGQPRQRITHRFTDYQRFVTSGKLIQ